jgi:transcriptional regulator with XRE-family HTH domain
MRSTPEQRKLVAAGLSPNVGRALALVREFRGLSQAELARRAGLGKSQISKYLSGRELPKLDNLSKVLTALRIGFLELFYIVRLLDQLESELGSEAGVSCEFLMLRDAQFFDSEVSEAFRCLFDQAMALFKVIVRVKVGRNDKP